MRKYVLWVVIAVVLTATSCLKGGNDSTVTCSYDSCQLKAPDSETVKIETYLAANSITAVKHCSGIYYTIVTAGTGDSPTPCSAVAVNYTGTLTNGTVFDKSDAPVVFSLSGLITGWKSGLPLAKRGGKIKLYIPPSLGYGPNATTDGKVPGNSILIFDIDLIDFQ